ncbi:hypothetical protein GLYMA_09G023901v4 [Glycine max]|nr:hypothetical protein GLYMA_09G023901v4 [Glycine max]KAH1041159.1 hypothetical protein GYH30_023809 [Glycine max]
MITLTCILNAIVVVILGCSPELMCYGESFIELQLDLQ